jgi:predicted RNase H-like HicB family nuclease
MEKKKVIVHVDWEDNYCAGVESLACVATGQTIAELKQRMEEALQWHLEALREDKDEIPAEFQGKYELSYQLTAQALLKSSQSLVTQAALSRVTGINQQQLSHYSTGLRRPRLVQRERIVQGLHKLGHELLEVE